MKRTTAIITGISLIFSFLSFRIISLNYSSYNLAGSTYSTKTLLVGEKRGDILFSDGVKAVNKTEKILCAVKPGATSLQDTKSFSGDVIRSIANGQPVLTEVDSLINNEDCISFAVPQRYDGSTFCSHIIGYTNSENIGQTGIECAYNEFLTQNGGRITVTYPTDASGRSLSGLVPQVENTGFDSKANIVLTVNSKIQKIAENAMDDNGIECGACVIIRVEDGSVAGIVSRPGYSPADIEQALAQENSPLINKAFSAYNVGSVFKPILSAFCMENGQNDLEYTCDGSTQVGDTQYHCNNQNAHGKINMQEALCVSCNTFFINLMKNCDDEALYDFCCNFGFSSGVSFGDGLISNSGSLPTAQELSSWGEKASFSFGQGKLTATPLQMACAYNVFCNSGVYKYPYIVKGITDSNGNYTPAGTKPDSKIISESTCTKIKSLLQNVVENGNAYNAKCTNVKTAGKTGTAQSGIYNNENEEILRTWFVGFFPVENPKYTVCIMNENGVGGGIDCAPVFRQIAQNITEGYIE